MKEKQKFCIENNYIDTQAKASLLILAQFENSP